MNSAKRSFKGCREEHKMIKLEKLISLSDGKTVSGRFSSEWTKTFEGIKIPHRKQDCLDCGNRKNCSDCVIKPKMNCFNCKVDRTCESCLDLVSQRKTYTTDNNRLKREPANECHQMLAWYIGEYKPKTSSFNFEAVKAVLLTAEKPMIEKR